MTYLRIEDGIKTLDDTIPKLTQKCPLTAVTLAISDPEESNIIINIDFLKLFLKSIAIKDLVLLQLEFYIFCKRIKIVFLSVSHLRHLHYGF